MTMMALTPADQQTIHRIRFKVAKARAWFNYEESKEYVQYQGNTYIHRFSPIGDEMTIVSSNDLEIAADMALFQIGFYTTERKKTCY